MATQQHNGEPAFVNEIVSETANASDIRSIVFSAKDRGGYSLLDWFPVDLLAALESPANADFQISLKDCSSICREIAFTISRPFPHARHTPRCSSLLAGDLVGIETPSRELYRNSVHLAVRLSDGRLTFVQSEDVVVETYKLPKSTLECEITRLETRDGETGEPIEAHHIIVLGRLLTHKQPDRSPIRYGGCGRLGQVSTMDLKDRSWHEGIILRDGSMEPEIPAGSHVFFDQKREAADGDLVVALVEHVRELPKPWPWQRRKLEAWHESPFSFLESAKGHTVRRLRIDASGQRRYLPLNGSFPSWIEGAVDSLGYKTWVTELGPVV